MFSSLNDPVDLARAIAALESAWTEIKTRKIGLLGSDEQERDRLKFIIASLTPIALDEDEIVDRSIAIFAEHTERV